MMKYNKVLREESDNVMKLKGLVFFLNFNL